MTSAHLSRNYLPLLMTKLANLQRVIIPWVPMILRLGLGFVFLWSGLSKLGFDANPLGVCTNRAEAVSLVESFIWLPIDPELFVIIQSWAEVLLGAALVAGVWVEAAGLLSAVLFLLFFATLDFSLVWKNVGLLALSLGVFAAPPDAGRLDRFWRRTGGGVS